MGKGIGPGFIPAFKFVKFKLHGPYFKDLEGKGMPLLPRSPANRVIAAIFIVWIIAMNLQALGVIATSLEPWIGGIPFSLFFMWAFTALATIAGIAAYAIWGKEFEKNAERALKEA